MGTRTVCMLVETCFMGLIQEPINVNLVNHKFPTKEKVGNLVPNYEMFHRLVTLYFLIREVGLQIASTVNKSAT
jgi:hypothetical protein